MSLLELSFLEVSVLHLRCSYSGSVSKDFNCGSLYYLLGFVKVVVYGFNSSVKTVVCDAVSFMGS